VDNLYRPKKNNYSVNCFRRYIKQFIDFYNYGYLNKNGKKQLAHCKEFIDFILTCKTPVRNKKTGEVHLIRDLSKVKLKDKQIKQHLSKKGTYYYTSNSTSNISLLMIDLDPLYDTTDNDYDLAVNYILSHYHSGAYCEVSSTGRGRSIYFLLDLSAFLDMGIVYNHQEVNDYIKRYSNILKEDINSKYHVKFDKICGLMRYPNYTNRGILGRIPCPINDEQREKFYNLRVQTKAGIDKNIKEITGGPTSHSKPSAKSSPSPGLQRKPKTTSSTSLSPPHPLTHNVLRAQIQNTKNKMYSKLPQERVLYSVLYLCHKILKRLPTEDEFYRFYMEIGLFTGGNSEEEKRKRIERYNEAIKIVEKTFDGERCKADYIVKEYKEEIIQSISIEEVKQISKETGYDRRVTYEDLLVGFGYHLLCAIGNSKPGKELTCPVDGMVAFFKALKGKGVIKRSCNSHKVRAIRAVLLKIKWIELLDANYICTGVKAEGVAKKYSIGISAPNYNEFMVVRGRLVKQVKKFMHTKTLEFLKS